MNVKDARRRDGEKDIFGLGRWQKVALGQLEGFHTEGLLKLTYLSTGLWLWIASYGHSRNCIVQSQGKIRNKREELLSLLPNSSK
jgi:hypothetical protein